MSNFNQKIPNILISAAIYSTTSGREIGPYFLGISFEAIQRKYAKKFQSNMLELREISIELVRNKTGFKKAQESIRSGENSACMFL